MKKVILTAILLIGLLSYSQKESAFTKISQVSVASLTKQRPNLNTDGILYYALDLNLLKQSLSNVSSKISGLNGVEVEFPNTFGGSEKFMVW